MEHISQTPLDIFTPFEVLWNKRVPQMGALLAACRELAVVYNTLLKVKYLEYLTYTPHDFVVIIYNSSFYISLIISNFTPQPFGLEGYYRTGPCGRLPNFAECISQKPLDRISPFHVLWNCLDLKLCNVMVICEFVSYGLADGPKTCQIWCQWVQTLQNAYLLNCWMCLHRWKFYRIA